MASGYPHEGYNHLRSDQPSTSRAGEYRYSDVRASYPTHSGLPDYLREPAESSTSTSSPTASSSSAAGPAKKVSSKQLSCERCRRKRSKCATEPGNPKCNGCMDSGHECIFSGVDRRKQNLKEVRSRMSELAANLEKFRSCTDEELASVRREVFSSSKSGGDGQLSDASGRLGQTSSSSRLQRSSSLSSLDDNDDEVARELSTMVDRHTISDDGTVRAYGTISNLVFVDNRDHKPYRDRLLQTEKELALLRGRHLVPHGTDLATVEHLLHLYYLWHLPVFSLISRQIFTEDMYTGGRYYSPLLLNAILALASQFSDWPGIRTDPKDPFTAGAQFWDLAKHLLEDELERPGVTTVQALCLMAHREAASARDGRGWLYAGSACRLALDIGLHLDATPLVKDGILSERDAYARAVTYRGVTLVDAEYAVLIGRPSGLQGVRVTCRYPTAEAEDYDWWQSLREGKIIPKAPTKAGPGLMYFAAQMKDMSDTFREAMADIYFSEVADSKVDHRTRADLLARASALTKDCKRKMAALPAITRLDGTLGEDALPPLLVTHQGYNNSILLVNRPLLGYDNRIYVDNPRQRCFDAALELVDAMHVLRRATPARLRIHVNCQQFTVVSAALVFLYELIRLDPMSTDKQAVSRRETAQRKLDDCIMFLEEMAYCRPSCKRALHIVNEYVRKNLKFDVRALGRLGPTIKDLRQKDGHSPTRFDGGPHQPDAGFADFNNIQSSFFSTAPLQQSSQPGVNSVNYA